MKTFFSIIIPAYNCEKFIHECIKSITLNQDIDKKKIEIIIINDKSTDKTLDVIKKLKKTYSFIKILNNKTNRGVSYTRNRGIKNSSGEYLIFIDSDDFLANNCLESLRLSIKKKKTDVIYARYRKKTYPINNDLILKNIKNLKNQKNEFIKKIIKKKFPIDECWQFIVNRNFLIKNKINFLDLRVAEDQLYVVKILCLMKTFSVYKKDFYIHNNLAGTLSDFMDSNSTYCCLKVLLEYVKILGSLKNNNTNLAGLINKYIQSIFSMFSALLIMRSNKEIYNLSKTIRYYSKYLDLLIKYPEKINLGYLIKTKGNYKALISFRKLIINKNKFIINEFIKKKKNIYIYCYSKFLGASSIIMKNMWFKVRFILDENKNLINKNFKAKKIKHPNLISLGKDDGIIINNHRELTIKKIYKKLLLKNLDKKNILSLRY